ncbi:fibronectin type III domain-containing protein [Candidatus Poriferisodalis sp.]|uniref:fibronectin type III domain-containing protein n=1 Tax=Candidatus Poriferisodalis sp. TaxID=3101277 RepID=UPI003AF50A1F
MAGRISLLGRVAGVRSAGSLRWFGAATVVIVGLLAGPPAGAQTHAAVVPPPSFFVHCGASFPRTAIPVVVASDAAAQSDLYSAVTLAGVVGTSCIILAGPRDEPMPADQQALLDRTSAEGYIVGGTAAVPDSKLAGRTMVRIAGVDRWQTARLVGREAIAQAGGQPPRADASLGAENPRTSCHFDTPIVVASDAAAQSDLYSAVTLAGVIGTDCIILAGHRDKIMPGEQRARLDAASGGGYIVGGTKAVPNEKLFGRNMVRISGLNRWNTANAVGAEALRIADPSDPGSADSASTDSNATEPNEDSDVLESPQFLPMPMRIDGDWTIPTFICAEEGKYQSGDLNRLVQRLNDELDGFFERLSSRQMTLRFRTSSVLTDDIAWDELSIADARTEGIEPCAQAAKQQSGTSQVLIVVDLPVDFIAGYARLSSGPAFAATYDGWTEKASFLRSVVHELGHSILGLHHLKLVRLGDVFLDEDSSARSVFYEEPRLACYQYDQLDWPVPDYAEPCERLTPSAPRSTSIGRKYADGYQVAWEPPLFSDDAAISGYTVEISSEGDFSCTGTRWNPAHSTSNHCRIEKGPESRLHTFDLAAAEPGKYGIAVTANTKYGQGDRSTYSFDIGPVPPSFGPIRTQTITNTTIQLAWNTESHANFREEHSADVEYEIAYTANGLRLVQRAWGRNRYFDTRAVLTDLDEGTEYEIQVRACSRTLSARNCAGWNTLSVSTSSTVPPPEAVSVASGAGWYLLTWEPVPGAKSYLLELPSGAWHRHIAPDYGTGFNVQPGSTYSIKIRSCSSVVLSCDDSEETTVTFTTAAEPAIPPPYSVALQEIDESTATVMLGTLEPWTTLDPDLQYRIEYEYTDGETSSGLRTDRLHRSNLQLLSLSVMTGKTYTLKVRYCEEPEAVDVCSAWAVITFSNPSAMSMLGPPSLRLADVGDVWLEFAWDPVPGARSYYWRYQEAGREKSWVYGRDVEHDIEAAYGVEPGSTYTVQVRACGDPTQPCGEWGTAAFTSRSSLTPLPRSYPVSISGITDTQVQLEWNPPEEYPYYAFKWYPTDERGDVFVQGDIGYGDDRVITGLNPSTRYTIAIRTCSWRDDVPCTDWVATEITTLPRS